MSQMVISIDREYGSNGRVIGKALAKEYGVPFYGSSLLEVIYEDDPAAADRLRHYEEKKPNRLFCRRVVGHSNSIEENVAMIEGEFLREQMDKGESFVIVGRLSSHLFRMHPNHIAFFVLGDHEDKVRSVMEREGVNIREAEEMMRYNDYKRKNYHNSYSDIKWGDSRGYDLCINSSKLGIEGTIDFLKIFIDRRMKEIGK